MNSSGERAWASYDAYLFDIDGTLLNCTDALHYFAFCDTLTSVAGRPLNLDGVVAHGNTDTGILRDALRLAGVPDAAWRPRLREIYAAMCAHVEANQADLRPVVLPHVERVLSHLQAKGALLGVATGNLRGIGRLKLGRCGLLPYFRVEGFSDGMEVRADVIATAAAAARALAGQHASLCVVGDTPADVEAAQANGLDVIAVATGVYPVEDLATCRPTRAIRSLAELKT